jgi:hypothetical protein
MSQKDYINKKKITQILSEKNKLGSILESQQLTDYKSLILSNTILSETEEFDPLNTSLQQNTIYNAVSVPTCPSFIFCKNTLDRINRQSTQRELSVCRHNNYTNSMNNQYWKDKKNNQIKPNIPCYRQPKPQYKYKLCFL